MPADGKQVRIENVTNRGMMGGKKTELLEPTIPCFASSSSSSSSPFFFFFFVCVQNDPRWSQNNCTDSVTPAAEQSV